VQEVLGLHGLPQEVQPESLESETFLKALHHVLLEVHVEEGALICPESGE
jgi:multifunctional methyltransferase subunit TRM112